MKYNKLPIFSLYIIVSIIGTSLLAPKAHAFEQTLRISPVIINVQLSPHKIYKNDITIENLTNAPMPLRATLNDFVTQGEEGGYIFTESTTNPLLSWTKLNQDTFILHPKEKKHITLTIATPKSISLGGYYGILFFEPILEGAQTQQTQVATKIGVLLLANIGVPDPKMPNAEIETFSTGLLHQPGDIPLLLRVKNTALNFFTAKPILTITPLFFFSQKEETRYLEEKIIFPGKIRRWETTSSLQNLQPNIYKLHLTVASGNSRMVQADRYLIIFPISKALIAITLIAFILLLILKRKRLRKAGKALFHP